MIELKDVVVCQYGDNVNGITLPYDEVRDLSKFNSVPIVIWFDYKGKQRYNYKCIGYVKTAYKIDSNCVYGDVVIFLEEHRGFGYSYYIVRVNGVDEQNQMHGVGVDAIVFA